MTPLSRFTLLVVSLAFAISCAPSISQAQSAKEALTAVKKGLQAGDEEKLKEGLEAAISAGGAKTMKSLLSFAGKMPADSDRLYWPLLEAIASFVDQPALTELGSYIAKSRSKPIARDLLHALQVSRSKNVVFALDPVLRKGSPALRYKAVLKLATLRSQRAIGLLIEVIQAEEKESKEEPTAVMFAAIDGLQALTGQRFGRSVLNWVGWWEKHRGKSITVDPDKTAIEGRRTGTAVDHLVSLRAKEFAGLEKAPKKGVIVISAIYKKKLQRDLNNDHMEHILQAMGVPHEVVPREDFLGFDLSETGAILVNCAQFHKFCICPTCKPSGGVNNRLRRCSGCNKHINFSAEFSTAAVEKIRDFVLAGGYLFCEDWVVKELLEKAFPKFVAAGDKLKENTVKIAPVRGMATHPYLEGIFVAKLEDQEDDDGFTLDGDDDDFELDDDDDDADEVGDDSGSGRRGRTIVIPPSSKEEDEDPSLLKIRHQWKIDDESFRLRVQDKKKVLALLGSGDIPDEKGRDKVEIVALAFRPGAGGSDKFEIGSSRSKRAKGISGVVVQVLSHFGKQSSREDEHTLENLLLNFLIDANVARQARQQRGGDKKGVRKR